MTTFSSQELAQRTIERRAVEAVIWGMPAVNFDRMYQAMVHDAKAGEGSNKIVFWSRPSTLEKPDSHAEPGHHLPDAFLQHQGRGASGAGDPARRQRARSPARWTTAGRPPSRTSARRRRQGQGRQVPDPAARLQRQRSRRIHPHAIRDLSGYALLRSNLKSSSDADIANAVAYGKRIKVYPLSQAAHPPDTQFIDAIDVVFDATIPYDLRFFQSLDRVVQIEPWLPATRS